MGELMTEPGEDYEVEAWRCIEHSVVELDGVRHIRMTVEHLDGHRRLKHWAVRGDGGVGTTWVTLTERCA